VYHHHNPSVRSKETLPRPVATLNQESVSKRIMPSTYFRPIDILYAYVFAIGYNFIYIAWLFVTRNLPVLEPSFTARPTTKNEVAIVTGSSSGIGFETARELVVNYGMTVIIACRSRSRSMAAAEIINAEVALQQQQQGYNKGRAVVVHALDLSSFTSVRGFAAAVKRKFAKIHVLVNNAGMLGGQVVASEGGLDLTFQSNFLGHFLLTSQLMDAFAPQARVLNQTALGHHFCGGYDVENPNFWRSCAIAGERPDKTYLFSKLAQLLFTTELNRRYSDRIRSFAVNPGVV
jgi:NAD(P)-dependent dehydrogenase (short-subunit alcohol dehydrogenase family)